MQKTVGIGEAMANLPELVSELTQTNGRIVIRRHRKLVAALVPMHDLKRLEAEDERERRKAERLVNRPRKNSISRPPRGLRRS